jgi:hypothetical protein
MSKIGSLADVERLCWSLSGWQVEQRDVDRLLDAVRLYAGSSGAAAPLVVEGGGAEKAADGPSEPLAPPVGTPEPPDPTEEAQASVQRLHVTGTITLVCTDTCHRLTRGRAAPAKPRKSRPVHDPSVPEETRACRLCGDVQSIAAYHVDSHGLRGRKSVCQACENKRKRDARAARREAAA